MSTYIHRSIEPVLKEMVGQFPAVAVTGPRQSGKPTVSRPLSSDVRLLPLAKFLAEAVSKGLSA